MKHWRYEENKRGAMFDVNCFGSASPRAEYRNSLLYMYYCLLS
jgi:hypothetical protein